MDTLVHLKNVLEKNPKEVLQRTKQLFRFSDSYKKHLQVLASLIEDNYVPILYANHQSHADGLIISILIEELRKLLSPEKLRGFFCPVAASMTNGNQNDKVQDVTTMFQPLFNNIGFIYIPIIREVDRQRYGMVGSNRQAIEKLLFAPQKKYGLAVFPEGVIQGGRKGKDGHINGMRPVEDGGILLRCISFWQSQGKKSVLLPVGIANSYLIFNPDNYEIPNWLTEMILTKGKIKQLVDVTVGKPLTIEFITHELGTSLDPKNQEHIDYLMRKVATLLPSEARGHYGS